MARETANEIVTLRDGERVRLRAMAPEDETRLQDLLDHMSLEDVRHRFFAPVRQLSPALARHLSHPDPRREVAIVAVPAEGDTILGVARLAALDDGDRPNPAPDRRGPAEYAIAVRTDRKGHGLGYLMLGRLIDAAELHGFSEIWGDVMRDNEAMLLMAREHGFHVADHPNEGDLLRVTKRLEPSTLPKDDG